MTLSKPTSLEKSNIQIDKEARLKTAEALSSFLGSTYILNMKTLSYHWNVTGMQFHSLHALFEEQYHALIKAGDELAERIRALGLNAPISLQALIELSELEEDKTLPTTARDMVKSLLHDHESCSNQAKRVLEVTESEGDEVTADMIIERMDFHEKSAWMLRSIAQ